MNFVRNSLKKSSLLLVIAILTLSSACANELQTTESANGYPLTIENCSRMITIEKPPENIYVIGGEAGTIVHAAGGSDLVGTFSPLIDEPLGDAEDALKSANLNPIQTATDMSREMIIGSDADLLVTFGVSGFDPEDLESVGIPTYIINGYCGGFGAGQSTIENPIEGIFEDINALGEIFSTQDVAESAVEDFRDRVEAVNILASESSTSTISTAALFVSGTDTGIGAYGNRSMLHQQMEYLGLSNIFEDTNERYFEPSIESFINEEPERIIALFEPGDITEEDVIASLTNRKDITDVPAIVSENIIVLDFFYSGHGTLAIDGLEILMELIQAESELE
ncbi:ABC transporter substrate-binding protein [Alkalihalobacillus trypoxylicola]|uniref:Fe/B12 periplasmic-binding domain-containing protein n=1 Tax=Alkalihalobacillus trypoxylicola TaxID=519424 RepID=A0A161PAK8_9BACI|nr:ABC transporter substrate-binding protein [Alkalihalobacillus trypoxylicola]KYG28271.1 hypothetical protein AZF04_10255 [Alkalihalobacillus trypoxylicola]